MDPALLARQLVLIFAGAGIERLDDRLVTTTVNTLMDVTGTS